MRVFLKYAHICSYALYARSKIDFLNFLSIYINTCNDFKYYFTLQKICLYARIPNSISIFRQFYENKSMHVLTMYKHKIPKFTNRTVVLMQTNVENRFVLIVFVRV